MIGGSDGVVRRGVRSTVGDVSLDVLDGEKKNGVGPESVSVIACGVTEAGTPGPPMADTGSGSAAAAGAV